MAKTSNLNIRIDPQIKEQSEQIYGKFGITITDAVNIFLHKSIQCGGLPFDMVSEVPNAETIEAIKEVEEMRRNPSAYKAYSDVDEMMKDLLA